MPPDTSRRHSELAAMASEPPTTTVTLTPNISLTLYDGGGVARAHAVVRAYGRVVQLLPAADA